MSQEPPHTRPTEPDPTDSSSVPRTEQTPQPPGAVPPEQVPASQPLPRLKIRRTRISSTWVAIGFFAVILLLLLIFILQNGHTVEVSYLGFHGHLPLGVALLLSAVCGVLLVGLAGTARILQLRGAARRRRRAEKKVLVTQPRTPA